ncbi:winged helix-turn-helix domain-containing protein [Flavobacteriales bacterium]|nr:winged helix-turn-helix domain-containing protein [Flavobacteriales bacterium]
MLNSLITSKTRLRVLVKFFIRAANKGHLNALATEFGESTNGVRKELNKLKDAGYLLSNKEQNKVIYRANTNHPLYSILQDLVKKHLRLDEMVETIVKRIGDVQKIILVGDYAKGIDTGHIEVLLIADDINLNYIQELEKKIENKIGRKVTFSFKSKDDGIVLYDKNVMYYEN